MIKWLLRKNPALLGDLLEERASGRSAAWSWREVLTAVARSIERDARTYPALMLRAIATAMVVYSLGVLIVDLVEGFLFGFLYPWGGYLNLAPLAIFAATITGWVVARTHRACAGAAILAIIVLWTPLGIPIAGWTWLANILGFLAGALLSLNRGRKLGLE